MSSYLNYLNPWSNPKPGKTYRIIFLGDSGVGKTSIIRKFFHPDIDHKPSSTIFTDQYTYLFNNHKISFMDTAGQERYNALTSSYLRAPAMVILVFDIKEADTFRHLVNKWMSQVKSENYGQDVHFFVVANKVDLLNNPKESMRISDPYEYCYQAKIPFHLSSVKDINLIRNLFDAICLEMEKIITLEEEKESHERAFSTIAGNMVSSLGSTIKKPFTKTPVEDTSYESYVQEILGNREKVVPLITAKEMKDKLDETTRETLPMLPGGCCQ